MQTTQRAKGILYLATQGTGTSIGGNIVTLDQMTLMSLSPPPLKKIFGLMTVRKMCFRHERIPDALCV